MARYRNTSGNDLFIVALGKVVEDDGVFEVPDEQAAGFDCQIPTNYERLDDPAAPKKKAAKADDEETE